MFNQFLQAYEFGTNFEVGQLAVIQIGPGGVEQVFDPATVADEVDDSPYVRLYLQVTTNIVGDGLAFVTDSGGAALRPYRRVSELNWDTTFDEDTFVTVARDQPVFVKNNEAGNVSVLVSTYIPEVVA